MKVHLPVHLARHIIALWISGGGKCLFCMAMFTRDEETINGLAFPEQSNYTRHSYFQAIVKRLLGRTMGSSLNSGVVFNPKG